MAGLKDRVERETGIGVDFLNPFQILDQNQIGEAASLEDQKFLVPVALYLATTVGEDGL